jgi:hypothetical protein
MKLRFLGFVLVVLVSCAQDVDTSRIKAAIQTAYNAQSVAYAKADVAGVMKPLSKRYVDVNPGGDHSYEAYEKIIKRLLKAGIDVSVKVSDVQMNGSRAIVTADRHFAVTIQNSVTKETRQFVQEERLEDWWELEGKTWLKTRSTVLKILNNVGR